MEYVRQHRRRGHWRNGRWVRSTTVRSFNRRSRGRSAVSRAEGAARSWTRGQDRRVRHLVSASTKAQAVCTPGWQQRLMAAASTSVDAQLWSERPAICSRRDCRSLARTARSLLRYKKVLHVLAGNAAGEAWASFRPKKFEVKLARWLVQHFPQPTDIVFVKAARCLQGLGVLCCMSAGRDMTKCRCLQDLAKALTMAQLDSELRAVAREAAWPP